MDAAAARLRAPLDGPRAESYGGDYIYHGAAERLEYDGRAQERELYVPRHPRSLPPLLPPLRADHHRGSSNVWTGDSAGDACQGSAGYRCMTPAFSVATEPVATEAAREGTRRAGAAATTSSPAALGQCAASEGRLPGKRRRRHYNIATKVRSVQPVPRDRSGNYEMPVQVGVLMVIRLGRVVWDRDAFHNERYIWPVGYTVQREYHSMVDPDKDVIYTCWVGEGKGAPLFHIEAEDLPASPVVAPTATGAWTAVLRRVNQIRYREHSNSASGPDYFGFSHPTIAKMIQDLPGASMCRSYVMQHFIEMEDRHVRGVMKKGRGGRPSAEMLHRGQRALLASSSSSAVAAAVGATAAGSAGDAPSPRARRGPDASGSPDSTGLAKPISVAALVDASSPADSGPGSE
ncbi:hypothetical protein H4R18_004153 [Coemansia javaensis]|uniref:FYR N-terminal domain-containing protein n=1 Tax=Coemansia javaensis TaxID=2761396 RepID=A0A9W8H508_9FUNG|nr:hypothetical protein H4R18_004153 [Coemansia javaensis]